MALGDLAVLDERLGLLLMTMTATIIAIMTTATTVGTTMTTTPTDWSAEIKRTRKYYCEILFVEAKKV